MFLYGKGIQFLEENNKSTPLSIDYSSLCNQKCESSLLASQKLPWLWVASLASTSLAPSLHPHLRLVILFLCLCSQCLGPALLSCVDTPDRLSFISESNYPLQSQHYPPFQSTEPYYNTHNALGEAPPALQKPTNPRLYMPRPGCGYEFPGYLAPGSYAAPLHRDPAANHSSDLCDPRSVASVFTLVYPQPQP